MWENSTKLGSDTSVADNTWAGNKLPPHSRILESKYWLSALVVLAGLFWTGMGKLKEYFEDPADKVRREKVANERIEVVVLARTKIIQQLALTWCKVELSNKESWFWNTKVEATRTCVEWGITKTESIKCEIYTTDINWNQLCERDD